MSGLKASVGLACALMLSACVSGYSPSSITGGFEQQQLSDTTWRVTYNGNGYTTEETVQTYWLYRSAEIAIEQGYDGFQIISDVELTALPDGEARILPAVESGLGKPYMVADIRLLRAPLPERGRYVFDARAMQTFLAPYVNELCNGNVCPHVHRYLFPGMMAEAPTTR
ncbi:MAG: hypothetical protein ABL932_05095 [Terricaulis sp.]